MPGEHDWHYKRLFSHARMVEELLNWFVPAPDAGRFRFKAVYKRDPILVNDRGKQRISDLIWKILCLEEDSGEESPASLLLEVQSSPDPRMASRMISYKGLLGEILEIVDNTPVPEPPLIIPVVLYTGKGRWIAATDRESYAHRPLRRWHRYQPSPRYHLIDQKSYATEDLLGSNNLFAMLCVVQHPRDLRDVVRALRQLVQQLADPELASLKVFIDDFVRWQLRPVLDKLELPASAELQEILDMTNVDPDTFLGQWKEEWQEQARQEILEKIQVDPDTFLGQRKQEWQEQARQEILEKIQVDPDTFLGQRKQEWQEQARQEILEKIQVDPDTFLGHWKQEWQEQARQEILDKLQVEPDTFLGQRKQQWQEEARLKGIHEGKQEGILEGKQQGILEGKQQGILEGKQEGIVEGRLDGERRIVERLLLKKFPELPELPDWAQKRLASATEDELMRWTDTLPAATRLEEIVPRDSNGA